jgi:hypothetical protein
MSISPKIISIDSNKTIKLHMRIENKINAPLVGSINFIIQKPDGKKEKIFKKVKINKNSKRDFIIKKTLNKSYKEGFYKIIAFFLYRKNKILSLNRENDFFFIIGPEILKFKKDMFKFIKNKQILKRFKRDLNTFIKESKFK